MGRGLDALLGTASLALMAYHARRWRVDLQRAHAFREAAARPRAALRETPTVSVLVAAWNEAGAIARHIESVLALRYPSLEYVLCAGGADGTLEIARRYVGDARGRVTVLEQVAGEGKQRALERAFRHSSGEIVFLTDADCLLDDDAFERTLGPLLLDGETVATGASRPLAPRAGQGALAPLALLQYLRERYIATWSGERSGGLLGRNAAVRRRALSESGALAAPARTGTDYRTARALLAAGHTIRLVPHSLVTTPYASTPRVYARQQSRWLRNLFLHGLGTGDRYHLRHGVVAALTGATLIAGWLPASVWRPARLVGAAWTLAVLHALLGRCRQVAGGAVAAGTPVPPGVWLALPGWLVLDAAIWAAAPLQLAAQRSRYRW